MRYQIILTSTLEPTKLSTDAYDDSGLITLHEDLSIRDKGVFVYITKLVSTPSNPIDWYIAGTETPFKTYTHSNPTLPKILWTNDTECVSTTVNQLSDNQLHALCELINSTEQVENLDDWIEIIIKSKTQNQ